MLTYIWVLFMLWIHLSRGLRTKPLLWSCLAWLLRSWRVPEGWSSSCPWSVSYCYVVVVHCNVVVAMPLLCCWISPCFVSYCLLSVSLILSVISAKHYGYLQDRLQNAMVIQIKNWILQTSWCSWKVVPLRSQIIKQLSSYLLGNWTGGLTSSC